MGRQNIQKILKIKPVKQVDLEDIEQPEKTTYATFETRDPKADIPPVTDAERAVWAKTRAAQRVDERGQPVEGWAARIAAMLADGRLYQVGNVLYPRD